METEVKKENKLLSKEDIERILYDADPNCKHTIRAKEMWEGGGVVCTKCRGWFCF